MSTLPLQNPPLPDLSTIGSPGRSIRVMLLMATLVCLAVGDLYCTLHHYSSLGMVEINPIARWLLNSGSSAAIILFKFGSTGITVGILLKLRHRLIGEWTSWIAVAIMTALTLHWYNYNHVMIQEMANTDLSSFPKVMQMVADGSAGNGAG